MPTDLQTTDPTRDDHLPWTGERFLPEMSGETALEHLHRYFLAAEHATSKYVLDIASGEGYGSFVLAQSASQVYAVDVSEEAIRHAKRKYQRDNLRFIVGSCAAIPLSDASVDLIVSFETIEHHDQHIEMMRECTRVLKPDGLLIISSPDKYEYSIVPGTSNPFHAKELTTGEFADLLSGHFSSIKMFGQRVRYASMIGPATTEPTPSVTYESVQGILNRYPGFGRPHYVIAFASNRPLPDVIAAGLFYSPEIYPHLQEYTDLVAVTADLRTDQLQLRAQVEAAETVRDHVLQERSKIEEQLNLVLATLAQTERERDAEQDEKQAAFTQASALSVRLAAVSQRSTLFQNEAQALQSEVQALRSSASWRVTAPLRALSNAIRARSINHLSLRGRLGNLTRSLYRQLPLSIATKIRAKNWLYSTFGFVLGNTATFQAWLNQRTPEPTYIAPVATSNHSTGVNTILTEQSTAANTAVQLQWNHEYLSLKSFASTFLRQRIEHFEPRAYRLTDLSVADIDTCVATLRFANITMPNVSIVIPVFNNLKFTLECLLSIQQHVSDLDVEIVLVDDASSDRTAQVLPQISGVKYARNDANSGFVRTCNKGGALATGTYLVFLNNDVQVTRGWLDPLIVALEKDNSIGAVGPKIIYPNGRLQEAGTILNPDVSATLVGLAEDPGAAQYSEARPVDYCSGACLAMRRSLFIDLGGFDDTLAPSYCEDVDLSLKIRARGLNILYVPESVIVHHLSVTANSLHNRYKYWWGASNQQKVATRWQESLDRMNAVRLICFFLPQFHPIAENNRWWGKGFTEWTNVVKALPNFEGHNQPLLPTDLGFYDLRNPGVMQAQADLAKQYGIHGFCYYYYWFAGKRLLEAPLESLLTDSGSDMPFCLCWANENWSRRWDGNDAELLIGQSHSDQDDHAVIHDLMRYLTHPKYIRVSGKPILLVYRVTLFPDIAKTAALWRQECRAAGIGEIMLLSVESHDAAGAAKDPRQFGFDAAVEFPPHQMGVNATKPASVSPSFRGVFYDYVGVAKRYLQRELPAYPFFRGIIPRWDNTPRRQSSAGVFIDATPGAYQAWLEQIVGHTKQMHQGDARLLFINSWNEWAEGAHLEPDHVYGHAYLEATRNALFVTQSYYTH